MDIFGSLRNRLKQCDAKSDQDSIYSDIDETSALDGTSGDNYGQDEQSDTSLLPHSSDALFNSNPRSPSGEDRLHLSQVDENNNDHYNKKSNDSDLIQLNHLSDNSTLVCHTTISSSAGNHNKQTNSKLISRRRRSYRRWQCANDFGDYDHDGDIDRSDDEADNDDISNNDDLNSSEDDEDLSNSSNRWRQKKLFVIRSRLHRIKQQDEVKGHNSAVTKNNNTNANDRKSFSSTNSVINNSATQLGGRVPIVNNNQNRLDHKTVSDRYFDQDYENPPILTKVISLFKKLTLLESATTLNYFGIDQVAGATTSGSKKCLSYKIRKSSNKVYLNDRQSSGQQQQTNMPSGGNIRHTALHGFDNYRSTSRRSNSRSKMRESQRLIGPNGYSKFGQRQYNESPTKSILQEIKRIFLLLVIICVSCLILWKLYEALIDEYNFLGVIESPSILGHYEKYAVSTDAKPCAKIGRDILAKGGSSVDSAIATLICMGVVIPNSLGIGGGCLMTIYDSKKKVAIVIDGREVAPDYAHEHLFSPDKPLEASRGPLSVGIPGELAAYWKAHQMFGKLNWSELFDASIEMAENGSPVVEHLAYALQDKTHAQYISPPMRKVFTNNKTNSYLKEGEIIVQKELANTLRRIRDNGAKEFYGGLTGHLFVNDLKKQGGNITIEDLVRYEALVKEPLKFVLNANLTLFTQPPPGSGIVLSIILRIMKTLGYDQELKPQASFKSSTLYYHHLAEAFKFAYAQRAALEDKPDDPIRMEKLMNKLLSEDFIKESSSKIDDISHPSSYYGGLDFFSDDHGTAHVSVLDSGGNAAAITSSVNLYFGSGLISPSTGIIYNDVMDDFVSPNITNKFNLQPSKFNHIRPGRRPISSMAPSIFVDSDGNVRLVIGASGGSKITTAIASVALRNCFIGDDLKTSVDAPRIHHQFLPDVVEHESNFFKDILYSLSERGHQLKQIVGRSSVVMAVASEMKNGTRHITANSDYRKGGLVDGL